MLKAQNQFLYSVNKKMIEISFVINKIKFTITSRKLWIETDNPQKQIKKSPIAKKHPATITAEIFSLLFNNNVFLCFFYMGFTSAHQLG